MSGHSIATLCLAAALAVCAAARPEGKSNQAGDRTQPVVRRVTYRLVPLEKQLVATDQIVEFVRDDLIGSVDVKRPTFAQEVRYTVETSDATLVIDAVDVRGVLIQQDTWIETRIDARVRQVLEWSPRTTGASERIAVGSRLELRDVYGGETNIGSVLVRAGSLGLRAGAAYLVFIQRNPDSGRWDPVQLLELTNRNRIVQLTRSGTPRSRPGVLDGESLDRIVREIRRLPAGP